MLDKLTSTDFSTRLNQSFYIHPEGIEPLEAELIEVSDLGAAPDQEEGNSQRRAFSTIFRAPMEPLLPQAIYTVKHETMGTLDLFLVPLGPDQEGMRYEALFT